MADRIPLIVDSSSNQVKELPAGDSIILADNENVKIGTGNDLLLYHDGSHSYIKEAGTGDLRIDGDSVWLREADGTNQISVYQGTAKLYKDGTERLATSSSGVTVAGTLNVAGNVTYSGSSLTVEDTLTDGSTVTWNAINSPVAKVTLAGNRTITVSNNLGTGQYISVLVIQDGTGSRTLTWNAMFEFKDDTAPTLTTTASKGDLFTFRYNGAKWLEVGRNQNLSLS
jgi:hypothetical protein